MSNHNNERPLVTHPTTGEVYIVRGYTEEQKGQMIRGEDVVRPENHMWSGGRGGEHYGAMSTRRCPTYGTCDFCYSSGPVGKFCSNCNPDGKKIEKPDKLYSVMKATRSITGGSKEEMIVLDSQWLSELAGGKHEDARADRTIPTGSVGEPINLFSIIAFELATKRNLKSSGLVHDEELRAEYVRRYIAYKRGLRTEY
jgi:hypothetical protein